MILKQDYHISTIDDVVITFELINSLKPLHKRELKDKLDNFYKIQLIDNKHLEFIIYGIREDLSNKLNSLVNSFNKTFNEKISISENNYKDIQDFFKVESNVELFNDGMSIYETNIQSIHFYNLFYKNYSKKIVSLDSQLKTLIDETFKPDIEIINKFSFLFSLLK